MFMSLKEVATLLIVILLKTVKIFKKIPFPRIHNSFTLDLTNMMILNVQKNIII